MISILKPVTLFALLQMVSLSKGQADVPPTTAAAVNCSVFSTDQAECCGAEHSSCHFLNCSNSETGVVQTVCIGAEEPHNTSCDDGQTASDNICVLPITPQPATTPAPTTPAPAANGTTAEPTVNCAEYNSDQEQCCAAGDSACSFFNCTDASNMVSSTVCTEANATPECPADNTPSSNICESSSVDEPTQSPSAGGSGNGGFDVASFIGGIVLCAGIMVIAYFGYKFYVSRQERNYRSM